MIVRTGTFLSQRKFNVRARDDIRPRCGDLKSHHGDARSVAAGAPSRFFQYIFSNIAYKYSVVKKRYFNVTPMKSDWIENEQGLLEIRRRGQR